MSMLWMMWAWAAPPEVPTWAADDVEVATDIDVASAAAAPAVGSGSMARVPVEAAAVGLHSWADEVGLLAAIAGEWERRYYLVLTVRSGDEVVHWRQGPYDTPEQTLLVPVSLPPEAIAAVTSAGSGHLSTRIVATDFADVEKENRGMERIILTTIGDVVQGQPRALRDAGMEQMTGDTW